MSYFKSLMLWDNLRVFENRAQLTLDPIPQAINHSNWWETQRLVSYCCWHMTKDTWHFTANSHLFHLEQWHCAPCDQCLAWRLWAKVVNRSSQRPQEWAVCAYTPKIHNSPKTNVHLPVHTRTFAYIPEFFSVPGSLLGTKDKTWIDLTVIVHVA